VRHRAADSPCRSDRRRPNHARGHRRGGVDAVSRLGRHCDVERIRSWGAARRSLTRASPAPTSTVCRCILPQRLFGLERQLGPEACRRRRRAARDGATSGRSFSGPSRTRGATSRTVRLREIINKSGGFAPQSGSPQIAQLETRRYG
jgi:hypothetical protein